MAQNETEDDFDKETEEPSVTSINPNERKLARRLRIQKRLEAQSLLNTRKDGTKEEVHIEKSTTDKQIEASAESLEKLISEGEEAISNVRIANDAREIQRRNDESNVRRQFLQRLEDEAKLSQEKYEEVNSKWANILVSNDPLDIFSDMEAQTLRCTAILAEKDKLISELKQELMNADLKFTNDQQKQNEDITLLVDRIDDQIITMTKAFRRELALIEKNIEIERKLLFATNAKKWDTLYKERNHNEKDGIENRKQIMLQYDAEMKKVMIEHEEEFRVQKIRVETEQHVLQQQLQDMKAMCLMNIEKLNYNYMVLKRREDENIIIKNQQKRRINKLQDIVNTLKKTYSDLEESSKMDIQKLTDQVLKAHKGILELEEKSKHFTAINERQYLRIWNMNVNSINKLVNKILSVDQAIYKHALNLPWEPPEKALLTMKDLPSYNTTISSINPKKMEPNYKLKPVKFNTTVSKLDEINAERRLLQNILIQISDHSGFLIEDRLKRLLFSISDEDQHIMKVDNVLQALSIDSESEISMMLEFVLPYTYCSLCALRDDQVPSECRQSTETLVTETSEDSDKDFRKAETDAKITPIERHDLPIPCTKKLVRSAAIEYEYHGSENTNYSEHTETNDEVQCADQCMNTLGITAHRQASNMDKKYTLCNKGHPLTIQFTYVMRALREFLAKYHTVKRDERCLPVKGQLGYQQKTISRNLSIEDVTEFWKRYREVFPTQKEKLWDGLLIGLQKYHEVLKDRHKLNTETNNLRKQNAELRRLLEMYMQAT